MIAITTGSSIKVKPAERLRTPQGILCMPGFAHDHLFYVAICCCDCPEDDFRNGIASPGRYIKIEDSAQDIEQGPVT